MHPTRKIREDKMKHVKIGKKKVGDGHPTYIIAEIGINHNGGVDIAKDMIKVAKKSGADAIKFQTFKAEDFISDKNMEYEYFEGENRSKKIKESMYEMFKRHELSYDEQKEIFHFGKKQGIEIFSTPSYKGGVDFLEELETPAYKIGSDDLTNLELLEYISSKGKTTIISTGMSSQEEIEDAIEVFSKIGNKGNLVLMHCVSLYPSPPEYSNLRVIQSLKETFNVPVGFSDHSSGTLISALACALGANAIEKHFTLDKNMNGPDHWFSLDPEELGELVENIRTTEKALGTKKKELYDFEKEPHDNYRRSIVASVYIPEGTKITEDMIYYKRPGNGLLPKFKKQLVGKKTRVPINKNEQIDFSKVY